MKSPVAKRSVIIGLHKTSVSLEEAFWNGLKEIAKGRRLSLSDLVSEINTGRRQSNLSSAIRLAVLAHYRSRAILPAGYQIQTN
ncbi:ribbon-helix-helix domain-containing protein [Tardiphaga sp. P5_C10]